MPRDSRAIRFIRALLPANQARREGSTYQVTSGGRRLTLDLAHVAELQSAGVLLGDTTHCRAGAGARSWLRRQLADADAYAAQHRIPVPAADGATLNLAESPLLRLSKPAPGEAAAFLAGHQIVAGERVRRLAARAQLQARVTMSYSLTHTANAKGAGTGAEIGDMAADARRALADVIRILPRDCAGVVLDVCGLEKGLQAIEAERGWPRRSAKLVLRIGLDHLAAYWGMNAEAVGRDSGRDRSWLGEDARPTQFG